MKKLKVNAGKGYDILIEKGLIKDCGKYIVAVTRARKTAEIRSYHKHVFETRRCMYHE